MRKVGLAKRIQTAHSEGIVKIHLAMIARSEVFSPPPFGHLGCYASINPFELEARAGKPVAFYTEAGLAAEGIITCIEQPGSCIRQDMAVFESWYKMHWIPTDHELLSRQITSLNGIRCPNCGQRSKVVSTYEDDELIVRVRQCPKHKSLKWRTIEIPAGAVAPKGRPSSVVIGPKTGAYRRRSK